MRYLFLLASFAKIVRSQRPDNESICDYYAETLYGSNTNETQFRLIQSIVTVAYAGPLGIITNGSSNLTGIWNPGSYQGTAVNLMPFFDGSLDSTNLNGAPVGVNWTDSGLKPMEEYLLGTSSNVELASTSNTFQLFQHFFHAFSGTYACSQNFTLPKAGAQLDVAYVHKFMDLNQTDIAHFIDQFTYASQVFGFSETDAQAMSTSLNAAYNINCAPPVVRKGVQELLGICFADSCPLAVPTPDCAAYVSLQPTFVPNVTASATPTSVFTPSATSAQSASTTAASQITKSSTDSLSPGAIAGIALGSVAVAALVAGAVMLFFRHRSQSTKAVGDGIGVNGGEQARKEVWQSSPQTWPHVSSPSELWSEPAAAEMPSPPDPRHISIMSSISGRQ